MKINISRTDIIFVIKDLFSVLDPRHWRTEARRNKKGMTIPFDSRAIKIQKAGDKRFYYAALKTSD